MQFHQRHERSQEQVVQAAQKCGIQWDRYVSQASSIWKFDGDLLRQHEKNRRLVTMNPKLKFSEVSKATFEEHGIKSLNQYNYHPHMTIVELPSDEQELGKKLEAFKGHRLIGRQKFTGNYRKKNLEYKKNKIFEIFPE